MDSSRHLERAEQYSRSLSLERDQGTLEAGQGHAMRLVVYHGFAAIVEGLDELRRQLP